MSEQGLGGTGLDWMRCASGVDAVEQPTATKGMDPEGKVMSSVSGCQARPD